MVYEHSEFDKRLRALRQEVERRVAELETRKKRKAAWEAAKETAKRPLKVQPKMTAAERKHYKELSMLTPLTLMDFRWPELVKSILPAEWKDIPTDTIPDKTRITLRVDTDVARFYHKTGPGFQMRMNDVLRMFMLARLTEIIGVGREPVELIMAQDTKEKKALDRETELVQELEALRRKRLGME